MNVFSSSQTGSAPSIVAQGFWKKRLDGLEPAPVFVPGGGSAFVQEAAPALAVHEARAEAALDEALSRLAPSHRAKQVVLLAVLGVLSGRYAGTDESCVLVGGPEGLMPFRMSVNVSDDAKLLLSAVKTALLEDLSFAYGAVGNMITGEKWLAVVSPLLEVRELGLLPNATERPPCLRFTFGLEGGLTLSLTYPSPHFNAAYAERLATHFFHLLSAAVLHPANPSGSWPMLSDEETRGLIEGFNGTQAGFPDKETLVTIFARQAAATPNALAVQYGSTSLSYRQLYTLSGRIAHYLQSKGIGPGGLVGVMLPRSEWLVAAIFGILRSGAAYVPIDPAYPDQRIATIVEDGGITVVLTRKDLAHASASLPFVDLEDALREAASDEAAEPLVDPSGPAYVIYTSGSTGKPKGVMIEHRSVVNRLNWMQKEYALDRNDVLLLKTPVTFDVSVWELFWWTFAGASLAVLPPDAEKDPLAIAQAVNEYGVSTLHFVPSMLSVFLSAMDADARFPSLKRVFASGEALKPEHVAAFQSGHRATGVRLINLYGPTEATVDVSYHECVFDRTYRTVPIGLPIDNIRLYVLDRQGRICPVGIYGELHIAGIGLARGYLNNPTLTEEKFYHHPLLNERLYRTGDSARWLEDGTIEYGGRLDQQVKLRGFRIELGEIEAALTQVNDIREAAASVWGEGSDAVLVAYYVSDTELNAQTVQAQLEKRLPPYMVPQLYVRLDAMPLSAHGKLDRKALPEPVRNASATYTPPQTDTEEILVRLWSDVLAIPPASISINERFFRLGGNSLKLVQLNRLVNTAFNATLSMPDMFQHTTIAALAAHLAGRTNTGTSYRAEVQEEVDGMQNLLNVFNEL